MSDELYFWHYSVIIYLFTSIIITCAFVAIPLPLPISTYASRFIINLQSLV